MGPRIVTTEECEGKLESELNRLGLHGFYNHTALTTIAPNAARMAQQLLVRGFGTETAFHLMKLTLYDIVMLIGLTLLLVLLSERFNTTASAAKTHEAVHQTGSFG